MKERRRGRPPLKSSERKGVQITVRLKGETVAALKRTAKIHGVPLAQEITERLVESLEATPNQTALFGGRRTFAFALLLALTLRHLRELTGHWWHEDAFTFQHAKAAAVSLFDYCKPRGEPAPPKDIPGAKPGQVRRISVGLPYSKTAHGREAAAELLEAMEAFCGDYGRQYAKLQDRLPVEHREARKTNMSIYTRIGSALIPLHKRGARRKNSRGAPYVQTSKIGS